MQFNQNQISIALDSIIFDTDSYKWSHYAQYPEGTEYVWDYISSRGGQYVKTTFFGLQMFIKKYLCGQVVTQEAIEVADAFAKSHGEPFNREGWQYILDVHGGKLPLKIRAVREGAHIPFKNILVSLVNTDPKCGWLPSYVEPSILRGVWYPTTVATRSRFIKDVIRNYINNTSDDASGIDFKLHDFGSRGASSKETSGIGGAAHMVNFKGSDTITGILTAMKYYPEKDGSSPVIGFSIPASEHSSMTILGPDGEIDQMRRMITQFGGKFGLMACVSDGYDIYQACHKWGSLKDEIIASGSMVVVRPDCYSDDTSIMTDSGWKLFSDLTENDLVAQENNGVLEFVKPLKYVKQNYSGDMYKFSDNKGKFDFLVTPNHRMVFDYKGNEKIEFAENIKSLYNAHKFRRSVSLKDTGGKLTPMERLKIAFQADGAYVSNQTTCVRYSFSKNRKIERIREILNSGNYEYSEYILSDGKIEFNVKIDASNFRKDFKWVDFSTIDASWCREFVEELSYWDSCRRSDTRFKFDSCVFDGVVDVVERIALFAGYGCLISKYEDNRKEHFNDVYTCNILKNNRIDGQSITIEKTHYDGNVYCVQVPSGKILVKRNRATAICGNSGDPVDVTVKAMTILDKYFGHTVNTKGFKVLNNVRVIYGDGINELTINSILLKMEWDRWSADNIAFGMGGELLQTPNRDTNKWAMKASAACINGEWRDVFKDPITDPGKKSFKGQMSLYRNKVTGEYATMRIDQGYGIKDEWEDQMIDVFENGELLVEYSLQEIRDFADSNQ